MFTVNDTIVYGRTGICVIDAIEKKKYSVRDRIENNCYVLKPIYDSTSTIFVPVDNERLTSMMRRVLTKQEIDSLLESIKDGEEQWIDDQRERTEKFKEVLSKGIRRELLLMIKCLYERKTQLLKNGKKLCASDDGILKDAEREVSQEFAYALGIEVGEVGNYILSKLN